MSHAPQSSRGATGRRGRSAAREARRPARNPLARVTALTVAALRVAALTVVALRVAALTVAALTVAACALEPVTYTDLGGDLGPLRRAFNRDADKVRAVLLASPT